MHLRLCQIHGLVGLQVIFNPPSQVFDLLLHFVNVHVDCFQVWTELGVDDVVVLSRLSYVDALLQHFLELEKVF